MNNDVENHIKNSTYLDFQQAQQKEKIYSPWKPKQTMGGSWSGYVYQKQ